MSDLRNNRATGYSRLSNSVEANMGKQTEITPAYLSVLDAARYAALSPTTIRRLLAAEKIRGYRPTGKAGKILIPRDELDRYIRSAM